MDVDEYEQSKEKQTKEEIIASLQKSLSNEKLRGPYIISKLDENFYHTVIETLKQFDEYDRETLDPLFIELVRTRNGKLIRKVDSESSDFEPIGLTDQEYRYFKTMQKAKQVYRDGLFGALK